MVDIYVVICFQRNREDDEEKEFLCDGVDFISLNMQEAKEYYDKIGYTRFNIRYYKPVEKFLIKTKTGRDFPDGLINEECLYSEVIHDIPELELEKLKAE